MGVKCRCQRPRLGWANQSVTSGPMWAERLSNTTWMSRFAGDVEVDELEELEYVLAGVVLAAVIRGPRR